MKTFIWSAAAIATAGIMAGAPAHAADNIMKVCGAKYQAAKTAKTLPAGQTWNQFLASCRGSTPKTAAVSPMAAAPAARPMAAAPATRSIFAPAARPPAAPVAAAPSGRAAGTQSAGMAAMHDRQRQCGAQWKADKAAGKVPAGQTWPKYWSACNTRMKG